LKAKIWKTNWKIKKQGLQNKINQDSLYRGNSNSEAPIPAGNYIDGATQLTSNRRDGELEGILLNITIMVTCKLSKQASFTRLRRR